MARMWNPPNDKRAPDRLAAFGKVIRRARHRAGLSQQRLADLSGVSQTSISRVERAKAAHIPIDSILAIQEVLGGCFPIGICPHDHQCIWQSREAEERRWLHRPAAVP